MGGPERIIDRIACGDTMLGLAEELGVTRQQLSTWMNQDTARAEQLRLARAAAAGAFAEQSLRLADENPPELVQKTKLQVDVRRWVASRYDPDMWAEKPTTAINVTIGGLHMESLRRRPAAALPDPQVIDVEPLMD